ncbi:hypothetical protein MLD38_037803 [Melastoma candidum]|uniref:Uncharacterized protein n=1 Tax=Melastoma candidum TaxID=119954 RepID=A0ACB9LQH0_9MYRT|nr:hypothetical protein MLD38_037803 [Melastoma candidum]
MRAGRGSLFPLTKQSLSQLLNWSSSRSPQSLPIVHALILTTGLSVKDSLLTTLLSSLLDSGHVSPARKLFDGMHKPRIFLWNTVLRGYFRNGLPRESLFFYGSMRARSVRPDEFTLPFAVKACAELSGFESGQAVHSDGIKYGLEFFTEVRNELVLLYVRSGELGSAEWCLIAGFG